MKVVAGGDDLAANLDHVIVQTHVAQGSAHDIDAVPLGDGRKIDIRARPQLGQGGGIGLCVQRQHLVLSDPASAAVIAASDGWRLGAQALNPIARSAGQACMPNRPSLRRLTRRRRP